MIHKLYASEGGVSARLGDGSKAGGSGGGVGLDGGGGGDNRLACIYANAYSRSGADGHHGLGFRAGNLSGGERAVFFLRGCALLFAGAGPITVQ